MTGTASPGAASDHTNEELPAASSLSVLLSSRTTRCDSAARVDVLEKILERASDGRRGSEPQRLNEDLLASFERLHRYLQELERSRDVHLAAHDDLLQGRLTDLLERLQSHQDRWPRLLHRESGYDSGYASSLRTPEREDATQSHEGSELYESPWQDSDWSPEPTPTRPVLLPSNRSVSSHRSNDRGQQPGPSRGPSIASLPSIDHLRAPTAPARQHPELTATVYVASPNLRANVSSAR